MTVTEKVAYIKGLVDGLDLDAKKDEVKVIKAIIELLDDMAMSVSDLEEGLDVVSDQVDEIDEDLSDLEGYVYEDDDDCCCATTIAMRSSAPTAARLSASTTASLRTEALTAPTAALCSSSISMTIAAAAMTTATAITTTDKNQKKSNAAARRSCGAQFCFIRRKFAAALFISAAPIAQASEKSRRAISAKRRR